MILIFKYMSDKLLQIPVTLEKIQSMRNRIIRLQFDSQEATSDELIASVTSKVEKFGWLTFLVGENQIKPEDISDLPELPKTDPEEKSPSKILYNRMFVYFKEKKLDKDNDFQSWRSRQLDRLGQQYLDKLN